MSKVLKVTGLLVLGAILGQALLFGVDCLLIIYKVHNPNFLMFQALPSTAVDEMSPDELAAWDKMRAALQQGNYFAVNRLTGMTTNDLNVEVLPTKTLFTSGEPVVAVVRLTNVSNRALHVNEPKVKDLSPGEYNDHGVNELDYSVSISPLESSWMRTLLPGQDISVPVIIPAREKGPYKINYSLLIYKFGASAGGGKSGDVPVMKPVCGTFTIQ